MDALHDAIDWSRCVVGGSYALQQYTRSTWPVGDIDIVCKCVNQGAFKALVADFERHFPADKRPSLIKETLVTAGMRYTNVDPLVRDERFHNSIVATATFSVPEVPVPVQLVALDPSIHRLGDTDVVTHLNRITDLPACVSYTVANGRRIFHVPERGLEALCTKRVTRELVYAARRAKYAARGYTFV